MLQLENEYGAADLNDPYFKFVADLALSLKAEVPFLWCGGTVANFQGPEPFLWAFNGDDVADAGDTFGAQTPQYPLLWTENEGWYHPWGTSPIDGGLGAGFVENPDRSARDVAFAVARWVAHGGAFMNYYMYFGGQHHGNSAAAGVMNSYADGANVHADTLPNEPKASHLAALHTLMMKYEHVVMGTPRPIVPANVPLAPGTATLGMPRQHRPESSNSTVYAYVFGDDDSPESIIFLENRRGSPVPLLRSRGGGGDGAEVEAAAEAAAAATEVVAQLNPGTLPAAACGPADFPTDLSHRRYKGLAPGPANTSTELACMHACCLLGPTKCEVYQFSANDAAGSCWVGMYTKVTTSPTPGFASRGRAGAPPPSPPSPPSPPPSKTNSTVVFRGKTYTLPPATVLIVAASNGAVLYSSYNVSRYDTAREFVPVLLNACNASSNCGNSKASNTVGLNWTCWSEAPGLLPMPAGHPDPARRTVVISSKPKEQLLLTNDTTEHLVYQTSVPVRQLLAEVVVSGGGQPQSLAVVLQVQTRVSNAFVVLLDEVVVGSMWNAAHAEGATTLSTNINVSAWQQAASSSTSQQNATLTLLSVSLGMHSHVRTLDFKGIVGSVVLGGVDLTHNGWRHVVGLEGEARKVYTRGGSVGLNWSLSACKVAQPITWFKTTFSIEPPPLGVSIQTVLLDASGMSRGHFYLNGHDLGKYWLVEDRGGNPTQQYYHLPNPLLNFGCAQENTLVMGDELGGFYSAANQKQPRIVYSNLA